MPLKPGAKAPEFSLPSHAGATVALSALAGRKVVLYFYPRDGSPSCSVEASEFREHWTALTRAGAVLLGVSPDDVATHRKFRTSLRLPFALLADTDHAVAKRYRVWGAKSMFGTQYLGMLRTTFVIDEKGYIVKVFENVRTKGHAARVVSALP